MTSVSRLLAQYVEEHRSGGEADPSAYLERADPKQRPELAALIDAYLARVPRRPFDEAAFRESRSQATVDALERAIAGASGQWPVALPQLRRRAGLKRGQLVERLAQSLGVGARGEKVGLYYHQMEQGLLPADGVTDRVLEALASLLGSSARALREAGRPLAGLGGRQPATGPAFARATRADADVAFDLPSSPAPARKQWDEVDELFRGRNGP
jgi:hypothetical protein